ncbi:BTAD domain-containing putative transcriptional regulator [Kribbella sp. NPDC058693]|uniref:AfsR/SARP family transcriptional regulator n=1 Tax=Kribbella sp. NPDC058693 TaxID=3346602 RepID=UPI003664B2DA
MPGNDLWVSVLGPVRAWRGTAEVRLGGPQQRKTLAALLLSDSELVSVDELIDALWPIDPPPAAVQVIRTYVYRLRRELGADESLISPRDSGYAIRSTPETLDLAAFRDEVRQADIARRAGNLRNVATYLDAALARWTGQPLTGLSGEYVDRERAGLERERLAAVEAQLTNEIELGAYDDAAARLARLVAQHPLDERFRELLMAAFHRSGRTAEALAVFADAEQVLSDELALDPGPGLQALREEIVRDSSRPAQLPADLPGFVGRANELRAASGLLPPAGAPPTTVVIVGTAGIGKSSLAIHWAHEIAHRYPDGQLYLNLRGFDPGETVMDATEAIHGLLLGLGVPGAKIPADVDAQAAFYRSRLANRRVLILLDNARDAEQVRPLLPGTSGCLVIVTSRDGLSSLVVRDGARPLPLDLLSPEESRQFLAAQLSPVRLAAEPDAVQRLIDCSAGLPLALGIVAARAAANSDLPLSTIAAELFDGSSRLDALSAAELDSRSVFSWSYRALTLEAARLFRLLTLHPTGDIALDAAASLAGQDVRRTRSLLAELTRAHLLVERAPGRFWTHDLLHTYADELSRAIDADADRRTAFLRLMDYYLHATYAANHMLYPRDSTVTLPPPTDGTVGTEFADRDAALTWLMAEYRTVIAVAAEGAAVTPAQVWRLAWAVSDFLQRRGHWQDQVTVQRLALAAASGLGDVEGQAHAHRGLGAAMGRLGDLASAADELERARLLFQQLGDESNEARSRRALAFVRGAQDDYAAALADSEAALVLYRRAADLPGQASALNDVGWCLARLGRYSEALDHCRRAYAIFEELEIRDGQASTWDSLGYIHLQRRDFGQAVDSYQRAVRMFRLLGNRYDESASLLHLAESQEGSGDLAAARVTWDQALGLLDDLGRSEAADVRRHLATLGP